ncbi:hypothetical protein DCS_02041 [Drechmeria coniospora]|uniref:Uncharacterized protein n=1 Tax=Drechmeria coniospora TaxID=98403 RepID=A0A151GV49_DRECN|nr:hypothetical protein DCS_02041 [Drechmeria coniospora]KYK60902.1 hypothetical protein DCS_02041 [Drechmeria coniospora]
MDHNAHSPSMASHRILAAALLAMAVTINAQVNMKVLSFFSILAPDVFNSGTSTVHGNVGAYNDPAVGFPPGRVIDGDIYPPGNQTNEGRTWLLIAILKIPTITVDFELETPELGGLVLKPGVYRFVGGGAASLNGTLYLDANHDPNSRWVFNVLDDFTIESFARVVLLNGAVACNVIWGVNRNVLTGSNVDLHGYFIALGSITIGPGSTIFGGLYAYKLPVVLQDDTIYRCDAPPFIPPTGGAGIPSLPTEEGMGIPSTTTGIPSTADGTTTAIATLETTTTASDTASHKVTGSTDTDTIITSPRMRGSSRNTTTITKVITFTATCPVAPTVITSCGQEFYITSPGTMVLTATSIITAINSCKECAGSQPFQIRPTNRTPCPSCTSGRASGSRQSDGGREHLSELEIEVTAAASDLRSLGIYAIPVVALLMMAVHLL